MKVSDAKVHRTLGPAPQHGAILVIALVVLVAMTLASVGVFHSVDTSTLLSANIGFKRDTLARASVALKGVQTQLRQSNFRSKSETYCVTPTACAAGGNLINYSPQLLETGTDGIPVVLKNSTPTFLDNNFLASWTSNSSELNSMTAALVTVRYIIERACDVTGPPDMTHCAYANVGPLENAGRGDSRGDGEGGLGNTKADTNMLPLFKVTIRADGPRSTVAYAQAFYNIP